jgi:hypothetical protein
MCSLRFIFCLIGILLTVFGLALLRVFNKDHNCEADISIVIKICLAEQESRIAQVCC